MLVKAMDNLNIEWLLVFHFLNLHSSKEVFVVQSY